MLALEGAPDTQTTLTAIQAAPETAPPAPFEPVLECQPIGSDAVGWGMRHCTLAWDADIATDVHVTASAPAGWQVSLLHGFAGDPSALDTGSDQITLSFGDSAGADVTIGSRRDCAAPAAAEVALEIAPLPAGSEDASESASRHADPAILTIPAMADPDAHPRVELAAATFAPVDVSRQGDLTTSGTIELVYADVPTACGWAITISFSDFSSGDRVIPAGNVRAVAVDNADLSFSSEAGSITVTIPPGAGIGASGTLTITTELLLDGFVPQGSYQTTVLAELSALTEH